MYIFHWELVFSCLWLKVCCVPCFCQWWLACHWFPWTARWGSYCCLSCIILFSCVIVLRCVILFSCVIQITQLSLSSKFGQDPNSGSFILWLKIRKDLNSGCVDILFSICWGCLPLEVIFILLRVWVGGGWVAGQDRFYSTLLSIWWACHLGPSVVLIIWFIFSCGDKGNIQSAHAACTPNITS